ncbi:MAG: glycosyltransferase, partial [Cyanobacteriota bacterium]|nr:glycosyltransferase [Cyanobacteriota bacterium]
MTKKPLVSILINNYNYGRFLRDAIDSAIHQTYANTEVIVVDDGSTDNSKDIITGYGDKIIPILKENGGQASAFNVGFAASRGEIILLLDSDDIFSLEKAQEVVQVFESNSELGWCFHPQILIDTNKNEIFTKNYDQNLSGEYDIRPQIKRGKLHKYLPSFGLPATSGVCFRRSLLEKILPMPEADTISLSDS